MHSGRNSLPLKISALKVLYVDCHYILIIPQVHVSITLFQTHGIAMSVFTHILLFIGI